MSWRNPIKFTSVGIFEVDEVQLKHVKSVDGGISTNGYSVSWNAQRTDCCISQSRIAAQTYCRLSSTQIFLPLPSYSPMIGQPTGLSADWDIGITLSTIRRKNIHVTKRSMGRRSKCISIR